MQLDKILHGLSCYFISTVVFFVVMLFSSPWIALAAAVVLSSIVAVGKEFYDSKVPDHVASKKDLTADFIGVAVAAAFELAVVIRFLGI